MARFLTFNRATSEITELNSTTGAIAPIGTPVPAAELAALWDGRSRNCVALFRGDVYVLARTVVNTIEIHKWDGTVLSLVDGPVPAGFGGVMTPWTLSVENEFLVAVFAEIGGGPGAGVHITRSTDGAVFVPSPLLPVAFGDGNAAASTVWRQATFVATIDGLIAIGNPPDPDFFIGGPADIGDDAGLVSPATPFGSFGYWNDDLYFLQPDTGLGAQIYRLIPTWSTTGPHAGPEWSKQLVTGLPSAGALVLAPDGGTYCLFRSKADELVAIYSGPLGTKIAKTTAATFPVFTDITTAVLPGNIQVLLNAGVSLMEDDRRRTNQLQFFLVRDTALNGLHILSWDGVNAMSTVASLPATDLMPPNDQKADYRTFTAVEPSVEIDPATPPTQPFPGRVVLTYIVKDVLSREIAISPEYSLDGDEWSEMSEGSTGDGKTGLSSSPAGETHTFSWDAFNDLAGDASDVQMRIVARITGV